MEISLYILSKIPKDNIMYPRVLDRRGTAYERNGNWELAGKDLLLSLEIDPNQAYTLNYLAYTWIEQNKKLKEALSMLEKANKLYSKALIKFKDAYKTDRKNPDILNYLGFTLRKTGKLKEAEKYYLAGLKIKPDHNGINEYLGELYVNTNRMDLAKERLAVLKNCNCEEYSELKEIIEKK